MRCSLRDGRGKEPNGKESGWGRGNGKSKTTLELPPKLVLERNPWVTPTASCVSDEAEEEKVKLVRAPRGLADRIGEDVKRRGCDRERGVSLAAKVQTTEGHEAVRENPNRTIKRQIEGSNALIDVEEAK